MRLAPFFAGVATAAVILTMPAMAEDLKIGIKAEISVADPHVLFGPNRNVGGQVFEPLFHSDDKQRPVPALVASWEMSSPTEYVFKLRPNVKFHDGSTLTAEDVKYSIERARDLDSPRTFRTYLSGVKTVDAVDDTTFKITLKSPDAVLINNLSTFGIVKKSAVENASENDFNGGKAAIGTGPYKWVKWSPGDSIILEAFPDYWGGAPKYDKLTYKFIKNDSTRTAALISGDVNVIDDVPPNLVKRLEGEKKLRLFSGTSYMLNYLSIDQHHDQSLHIKGNDGQPIGNPLKDARVRKAISLLINRDLIAKRIMDGLATPANQMMPEGMDGYVEGLEPVAYDPAAAKKLLAEAGFPEGFQMTIHCTNDRYMNDAKVCEALGQLLSAGGIRTSVQTLPGSIFFERATSGGPNKEPEFALFMLGFGAANGVADAAFNALVQTYDKEAGRGANNRGRYSNPEVDRLSRAAAVEADPEKRKTLIAEATKIVMDDAGIIPVHHLNGIWASQSDYAVTPRTDLFTRENNVKHVTK